MKRLIIFARDVAPPRFLRPCLVEYNVLSNIISSVPPIHSRWLNKAIAASTAVDFPDTGSLLQLQVEHPQLKNVKDHSGKPWLPHLLLVSTFTIAIWTEFVAVFSGADIRKLQT